MRGHKRLLAVARHGYLAVKDLAYSSVWLGF